MLYDTFRLQLTFVGINILIHRVTCLIVLVKVFRWRLWANTDRQTHITTNINIHRSQSFNHFTTIIITIIVIIIIKFLAHLLQKNTCLTVSVHCCCLWGSCSKRGITEVNFEQLKTAWLVEAGCSKNVQWQQVPCSRSRMQEGMLTKLGSQLWHCILVSEPITAQHIFLHCTALLFMHLIILSARKFVRAEIKPSHIHKRPCQPSMQCISSFLAKFMNHFFCSNSYAMPTHKGMAKLSGPGWLVYWHDVSQS